MALKLPSETAAPVVPRDTSFELRRSKKDGALYVRATTYDGKKFRLLDITPSGVVLRPRNNHAHLGVATNSAGKVVTL